MIRQPGRAADLANWERLQGFLHNVSMGRGPKVLWQKWAWVQWGAQVQVSLGPSSHGSEWGPQPAAIHAFTAG